MTASRLVDNGAAQVLVLQDGQARLDTDRLLVSGGGSADVFAEDDQSIVQVAAGAPSTADLLRAVLANPSLTIVGDVVDVVVVTAAGWDRWVLSPDLAHQWLFTRHWAQRESGPVVAVAGHAPSDVATPGSRGGAGLSLEPAAGLLARAVGAPATMHLVHVHTRRTTGGGPGDVVVADRRPVAPVVADALGACAAVLAGWGAVRGDELEAADDMVARLRSCRDAGARVLVATHNGDLVVSGTPPQPADVGRLPRGAGLVDAPSEWLWGGGLA